MYRVQENAGESRKNQQEIFQKVNDALNITFCRCFPLLWDILLEEC
jgi:hypothetical protein